MDLATKICPIMTYFGCN